ncbi:hypothetical protein [Actinomadura chibensis]|uniref:Tetratricopeptide repeat protein n=1 Tax=Actinomadura chibensis TaxID=392828 RepID=A0A5D0NHX9_9ACTN|nr:hypothetical protein [Actinomadura chibensis]TYB43949.1 hypothetical protein FXF69_23575 [Actinomadura chibensis]
MTTTVGLETRPEKLHAIADRLWDRFEQGHRLRPEETDALAESCFRLAVLPGTEPGQAVSLLARAHRVDPVNPKHPYHIGLIHLRHGRLDAALEWLTAAAESAPANHRIWAHLSIVHQDLHDRRRGGGGRDPRSREIAAAVRAGRDDHVVLARSEAPDDSAAPPPVPEGPVASVLRPGRCRWSGMHDIDAGFDLRRPTSKRTRDLVAEALERTARLAAPRTGGTSAFVILAVQWMVHGYPSATVRRLAGALPPEDGPARRLLDLVCELFEADEEALPGRLAACLAEKRLPDLLIALIHQRRLWWRPLALPDLGAYTAARWFAEEGGQDDPTPHLNAMRSAVVALAARPEPLTDVPVRGGVDAGTAEERLAALERDADLVRRLRERAMGLAKQLRGADVRDPDRHARARADQTLLSDIARRLEAARVGRLQKLQELRTETGTLAPSADFDARLERCEKSLQQPIGLKAVIAKVGRRLHSAGKEFAKEAAAPSAAAAGPSAEAAAIGADLAVLEPEPVPAAVPPPDTGVPDAGPRSSAETVAEAVEAAERALAHNADRALRTLDAYPPSLRRRSALVLLRSYLDGRLAETWHRMGHSVEARRHWQAMLTENPMSAPVLHNLAVAHTGAGDLPAAAQAWRRYLEALYLEALVAGTPARGAAERARVHRVLAGSFGTAALCGRPPAEDVPDERPRGVPAELTSPARAALAVAHLRLEELNRALSYRGAVPRLGVARSVLRPELDAAFDARLELVATACAPLPERVRAPFEELCRDAFRAAHEAACDPGGRTREVTDPAEEEAHAAWARERMDWKERIARELTGAADWPVTESSGEVIAGLRLIDGLRLDPRDEALRRAAARLGHADPARHIALLNDLSGLAADFAVQKIFQAAERRLDSSTDFPDRYLRICLAWQRNGVSDRHLDLLDDPQPVYLPSVQPAMALLEDAGVADPEVRRAILAAVADMEHWVARFRGASGPAAMLGRLLRAVGEEDRARPLLAEAGAVAFAGASTARVWLAIESDDFADAAARLGGLAEKHAPGDPDWTVARGMMIETYERWVVSDGPLPSVARIRDDIRRWPGPQAEHAVQRLVVDVTINRHRRRPGDLDLESLATSLRRLLVEDAGNSFARYHLDRSLFQQAVEVRLRMKKSFGPSRDALRDELSRICGECASHAAELLDQVGDSRPPDAYHVLADPARRAEIETIFAKVRRYLP